MVLPQSQPQLASIRINEKWCKRCGICVAFCPRGVYTSASDGFPQITVPEKCVACKLCEIRCPDFAVTVERGESNGG